MALDKSNEFQFSEYVLILTKSKDYLRAKLEGVIGNKSHWYNPTFDDEIDDVTHWMPLSNPPKEK